MSTARKKALTEFTKDDPEDVTGVSNNRFSVGRREYLVLTDEEADEAAKEYIEETLWAFNRFLTFTIFPESSNTIFKNSVKNL